MPITNILKCSIDIDPRRAQKAVDDCPLGLSIITIAKELTVDLTLDAPVALTFEKVNLYAHWAVCNRCWSKWREWRETPTLPPDSESGPCPVCGPRDTLST